MIVSIQLIAQLTKNVHLIFMQLWHSPVFGMSIHQMVFGSYQEQECIRANGNFRWLQISLFKILYYSKAENKLVQTFCSASFEMPVSKFWCSSIIFHRISGHQLPEIINIPILLLTCTCFRDLIMTFKVNCHISWIYILITAWEESKTLTTHW